MLRQCLEESDMPNRGNRPLRACGTCFVVHKVAALGHLINHYRAYLPHLTSLIEHPKVKSVDKKKLRGYIRKRWDTKMLLGCALFHDMLPCAVLYKVLRRMKSVFGVIVSLLKTKKKSWQPQNHYLWNVPIVKKRSWVGLKMMEL